ALRRPPSPPLFPYTTLFRSGVDAASLAGAEPLAGVAAPAAGAAEAPAAAAASGVSAFVSSPAAAAGAAGASGSSSIGRVTPSSRSEEHTSELQSQSNLVCRL